MDHTHIQEFEDYNRCKGLVTKTIRRKKREVGRFIDFLYSRSITSIKKAGEKDITAYADLVWNQCRNISSGSFIQRLATVKDYFRFLTSNGYLIYDPSVKIELPKRKRNPPREILTESEILALLRSPDTQTVEGRLERLVMEILYSTGIRNRELVNLRIFDFNFRQHTIFVSKGKGSKDRVIPIGRTALNLVKQYVETDRKAVTRKTEEKGLLLNTYGRPLSSADVCHIVKKHIEKTGVGKKITPHCFRHTFAVHLLRNGADLVSIKEMLGHSDLTATQIYLKLCNEDLKKMQETCHPRDRLKVIDGGKNHA